MYESLAKGLAIYRQAHTKSIYVRLRIDGQELKKSLKTADIDEAKARAWALKFESEGKVLAGLPVHKSKIPTILEVCNVIIKHLENKKPFLVTYKDYIRNYKKYIIPYFKGKNIDSLTTKNIRLYFESLTLSQTTLTTNKTCFNRLFLYLEEEELLKKKDFPSLPKDIKTAKKEIGFNFTQRDLDTIREFINSSEYQNQSGMSYKTKEYRKIFPHVLTFLLETGIRTGAEMDNLMFSDLDYHDDKFLVKVRKGKKEDIDQREALLSYDAVEAIKEVLKITKGKEFTDEQLLNLGNKFIFETSFGKLCDFCKLFNNIIVRIKEKTRLKHKYTLYSCRHTYITTQLLKGASVYLVAKQVGNGIDVIQAHYDHVMLRDAKNADILVKDIASEVIF